MDKIVQFIANYDDWQAVKKIRIDSDTKPLDIMEFIASLSVSFDRKLEENLGKIIDLSKIDSFIAEYGEGKKKEEEIALMLKALSGPKLGKIINELVDSLGLEKKPVQEIKDFAKAYALRKALKDSKITIDYSGIEIPGMKKLKKAK